MEHTNSEGMRLGENIDNKQKVGTFYSSVTDHVYFQGTGSPPTRTADVAFVTLFAGMGFK